MICLFSLDKKGNVIIRPEAAKLFPAFSYLEHDEVRCIVLAYDHYALYRQFPEDERKRRAKAHVFSTSREKFFEEAKIKTAIAGYKVLQYDLRANQMYTYRERLEKLDQLFHLIPDDDMKGMRENIAMTNMLRDALTKIEKEIMEDEQAEITMDEDKRKLSFLEKLQSNVRRYQELKKQSA